MSDTEKNKRKRAVRIADAINATEGVPVQTDARAISLQWARGESSSTEMKQKQPRGVYEGDRSQLLLRRLQHLQNGRIVKKMLCPNAKSLQFFSLTHILTQNRKNGGGNNGHKSVGWNCNPRRKGCKAPQIPGRTHRLPLITRRSLVQVLLPQPIKSPRMA